MNLQNAKECLIIHYYVSENKIEIEISEILQITEKRVIQILTKHKIYDKCDPNNTRV